MNDFQQFLVTMGCIMAYALMIGITFAAVNASMTRKCNSTGRLISHSNCDHTFGTSVAAGVWPIGLPLMIAVGISNKIVSPNGAPKLSKVERRREAELEEMEHKLRVAALERKLVTEQEAFARSEI